MWNERKGQIALIDSRQRTNTHTYRTVEWRRVIGWLTCLLLDAPRPTASTEPKVGDKEDPPLLQRGSVRRENEVTSGGWRPLHSTQDEDVMQASSVFSFTLWQKVRDRLSFTFGLHSSSLVLFDCVLVKKRRRRSPLCRLSLFQQWDRGLDWLTLSFCWLGCNTQTTTGVGLGSHLTWNWKSSVPLHPQIKALSCLKRAPLLHQSVTFPRVTVWLKQRLTDPNGWRRLFCFVRP